MKNLKRILGLLLAVCVLAMSLPLTALAAAPTYSDTKGHWAEKVIEKWSEYDVVHGDGGKFRPNDPMTRGEFATVLTQLLGLEEKSANPFRDITGKEWYADAVLKAHAAGILMGDGKGNSNATSRIQRQEAFVMVGRALGVTPKSGDTSGALAGFSDKGQVSGWARPMVAALTEGGYVNGTTPTTLIPLSNINRASVMQLFGSTVKTYITKPGSYTADKGGFVVIKAKGNVTVSGDNAGVVVGAGSKGAHVTVTDAKIKDGAKVDAPDATVTLQSSDVGGTVTLSPGAENTEIVVPAGTTVEKIVTEADNVTVSGDGKVKAVEVAGGDKVNVSTPGTAVTVDKDAGSSVTAGGQTVKPGGNATTTGDGQGYGENGGGGGGAFIPPTPVYTIEYYVNGTKKETKTVAQSDEAKAPAPTAPTDPGYTFGTTWYTDAGCTTAYDDSKTIKEILGENGGTTLKLYIKGTPITYTVRFDGNGGSGSMSDMTGVAYNTTAKLTANTFTRSGYTFKGWAKTASGAVAYADEAPAKELATTDGATVTLYAVWEAKTYTVTYNGNGNTGGAVPGQQSWTFGTPALTAALPGNLEKTGHNFNGWNTQADGSGTAYATGASLGALSANITLYAQWSVKQFAVSFDAKGGAPVPGSVNLNYGTKVTAPNPAPTKTGYDLAGWYANEEYSGSAWDFANDTVTEATTLYAKWEPKKFAVTFDVKGGEQVDDTDYRQVPYDTTISAPDAPTREGYTFKGWYKEDTCTTPWSFTADKVTGAVTLYAKWEINTYTVTFDTDGGTPVEPQQVEYGGKAASPSATTKEGYTFDSWVTEKNGGTPFDFANTAITGNTTVYAKWNPIQHTVTYNGNGNTGGTVPGSATWTYGDDPFTAAEPDDLAKTDHTFGGWQVQGADTVYQPGETIELTEDITLVAQWIDTRVDGTITFNANYNGGSITTQTYAHDAAANSVSLTANTFTRTGYTFTGWNRNADGSGQSYADEAVLETNPGTITLYAQWAMDVTLRLGDYDGEKSIAGEYISGLQENSLLTLEAATAADLTYKAVGTAKYKAAFPNYFANFEGENGDGEKYSKDNAPVINDGSETPNYDWSGNFLVFDIVAENGKKTGATTVFVKSNNAEIVADANIVFGEVEGKQTATVAVKLDEDRKTNGIKVEIDWDGDGANAATYTLDVSEVELQPAPIVLGQTITAYDLENDTTVVGQTNGGVDLYPADLLKSISMEDGGETIKATLKYVKDTAAEEGPGYYLTFQVNSPVMDTQPDCTVKLFYQSWEDGDIPQVVLTGSDFVKNNDKYTATVAMKIDPATYNRGDVIMMVAAWSADNTWNEGMRGFGTNLEFMPQNTAALMATWDANEENTDHWPFLLGTSSEDGGHPALDLFVAGSGNPDENFKIEKQAEPEENTTVYNASGYLRFTEDFRGYANDRYPDEEPDPAQGKEPGQNWRAAVSGYYIPVDIVNVQSVDVTHAEAKVYDGPAHNGGQLIYTVPSSAFNRTVQTGSGDGYQNSATLIQNLNKPDGSELQGPLFIVVDWDTTDPDNTVETMVLQLGIQRQRQSRVRVTAYDQQNETIYGQGLNVDQNENFIAGTLIQTEPKTAGDTGYYLPLTFAPWNKEGASVTTEDLWVLEYRFGPEEPVVLKGTDFTDKTATVLLPVPQEVVDDPNGKGLEINADWDGRDFIPDVGTNTGHLLHGETGTRLDLSRLQFQSRYNLVSAHSRADETRLEAVPANQTYKYNYVNWEAENGPASAETTVTMSGQYEYDGKPIHELVGGDFRVTSDDGTTYYAVGTLKYTDGFNSYWFNRALDTFFYRGRTSAPGEPWIPEEHFAKRELVNAGLMQQSEFETWRESHNNAASFGYYIVFDLDKGDLTDGKIEIWDAAVSSEAAARVINADEFDENGKLPVVYQLKTKAEPPAPGESPFANQLTIKYFNAAGDTTTADKEVTLAFTKPAGEGGAEAEILHPQNIPEVRFDTLIPADNETQAGAKLESSAGPCDMLRDRDFTLYGGILKQEGTPPYKLTLDFSGSVPTDWPMVWDEETNGPVAIPNDTVVVQIDLYPKDETQHREPKTVTKAEINSPVVIDGVRSLSGIFVRVNWAGVNDAPDHWGEKHFYIGLNNLVYPPDETPVYALGTVLLSKAVTAASRTVTVDGTQIGGTGATGAPDAFSIVDVNIAYTGLYPKMTDMGEMVDYFGAVAIQAPAGAKKKCAVFARDTTPYQFIGWQPNWVQEYGMQNLDLLWCTGPKTQVQGASYNMISVNGEEGSCSTLAVQWFDESDQPLGAPVYYQITATSTEPHAKTETESYAQLYTAPTFAREFDPSVQPVFNEDGTWLYLEGSYDAATKTWAPQNWQPLGLVSSADPAYAEGYYVELELSAPMAVAAAASGMDDNTVLCIVTGGTMTGEEKIELKKSDLEFREKWGVSCAWLPVIVKVADSGTTAEEHGANVTFTVDWDGDGSAYTATTYTLDLSHVALEKSEPAPAPELAP